ncbi:STAS domain-containing protein [Streptodolium elevatio]|uniref:STAS domain-containing protein n=1 Tax=Streptodolium elevatio TaxID=3157996 RepID=A0ABV3DQ85_9ACTN
MSRYPAGPIRAPAQLVETPLLEMRTEHSLERAVVHLSGEIDPANADNLCAAFDEALTARPRHLHVDAAAVSFCDSSGLHALLHARERSAEVGATLSVEPGDYLERLLWLTGTTKLFPTTWTDAPTARRPAVG